MRFEASHGFDAIPLSSLAESCLQVSGASTAGLILVGESAGLVGAALRRSPVAMSHGIDLFEPTQARDWLSLTAEPEFARSTAVVVGIVTRENAGPLRSFVRPLGGPDGTTAQIFGHFHATVVPYRPLPRGALELSTLVQTLFESGRIETLLHLLNDTRPIVGVGESMFARGVFWSVPLVLSTGVEKATV